MNKFFKSSFHEGFDRDTSINKYDNSHLFNAENVRIISDDPLSNGAITSSRGTSSKGIITDPLGGVDVEIVGSCNIRDFAVICAYDSSGGAIYKFKDKGSASPEAGELELIYAHADLNFVSGKKIYMEGRYESETVQKIYFTDGETFFRHLNIVPANGAALPVDSTLVTVGSMDVVSDINFGEITAQLVSGGNLKAGKVQYAYQLYNITGSESVYSPTSPLYSIADSIDNARSSINVKGYKQGTFADKSAIVRISITDITDFNRLRLVALDYESINQTPSIRIVGEYEITGLSLLNVVDTGSSIGALTLEEFRFITNNFYPKTLASKDNILFAGNINELYFDITDQQFDARAYRFRYNTGTAKYESELLGNPYTPEEVVIPITYGVTNLATIDNKFDCYNPFNDLDNDGYYSKELNMNPVTGTLGGYGLNISYEFTTEQIAIDDGFAKISQSYGTSLYDKVTTEINDSTNIVDNLADYTGYQRDEIYRFGIVFFDLKGRPSFTKWIGDIRMPNNYQMPFITKTGNITYANHLGISFTVDTSPISTLISGYQIVRCDRTDLDKTIKDSGVVSCLAKPFNYYLTNDVDDKHHSVISMPTIYDCYNGKIMAKRYGEARAYSYDYAFLDDVAGAQVNKSLWEFVSPNIAFNKKIQLDSNDFTEMVGYVNTRAGGSDISVIDRSGGAALWLGDKLTNFFGRRKGTVLGPEVIKSTIQYSKLFTQDKPSESIYSLEGGISFMNICGNFVYGDGGGATDADTMFSERGSFLLIKYENDLNLADHDVTLNVNDYRWMMSYIRSNKNLSIYNGISYQSRLTNTYYQASKFIPKDTLTSNVYGGDIFINMFVYLRGIFTNRIAERHTAQSLMIFPVESTINTQFRLDEIQKYLTWYIGDANGDPKYTLAEKASYGVEMYNVEYPGEIGDLYRQNEAYHTIDKSKSFIPKPQDLNSNNIFDTRVYYSGVKISGELSDSWLKFKFNDYKDVDSQFGALTKLLNVNNKLMFCQPDGVGVLSVNDRALVQSPTSYSMTLGTGGVLERFDYLTFDSGASDQDDIIKSNKTFYYVDRARKKINKYEGTDTPISMIKGVNSLLKALDFIKVKTGFDPNYMDVFFSIDGITIAFNELTNNFTSSYSFNPNDFFSIGRNLYSIKDVINIQPLSIDGIVNVDYNNINDYILVNDGAGGDTIFKHNTGSTGLYYDGVTNDSIIDLIVHPEGNNICQFTALDFRMEITDVYGAEVFVDTKFNGYIVPVFDTIKTIKFTNSNMSKEFNVLYYHPTHILQPNEIFIKRIANAWRVQIPIMTSSIPSNANVGVTGSPARFIDTYLQIKLTFDNSTSKRWKLHDITTYYNPIKV